MMSEKFCLKWNDFESNVSKSFGLLRNEEYLHDVTLVCDDNSQVSAHKLVLSACSEYFKTIFRNNSHPGPLICLEGVSSPELRNILDYMYNGEANIFQENLDSFLSLAQRLKILGLLQNGDLQEDLKAEQNATDEETLPMVNNSQDSINISADNSNIEGQRNIERKVSLINGDQKEINIKVDEHIETCADRSLKCLICGKLANANKSGSERQAMRSHVETHLEGISYPCTFCEKTFRSRNALNSHNSRKHK